jgi:transcriptional regulator with XRE-family HTH domain
LPSVKPTPSAVDFAHAPGGASDAPEPGAETDPAIDIAGRLAAHRARRGIGVSELARRVGVSPSLISQIERGQSRPSVSTLFAIARALEVPVDAFFRGGDDDGAGAVEPPPVRPATSTAAMPDGDHRYLVHADERAAIDIDGGVRWERLTPTTLDHVDFLELIYGPAAESNPTLYRHPGSEMVLVLSGRLDIYLGFERYELGPGDSIHFPSSFPHRYVNPTDETARAVTVILHDDQGPSAPGKQRRA